MNSLVDILAYLLKDYPHPGDLSNARVTKLVYLADWKHVVDRNERLTTIPWIFNNFGPFVWNIKDTAVLNSRLFDVNTEQNLYGSRKTSLSLTPAGESYATSLSDSAVEVLDHVLKTTAPLNFDVFIRLVYSTYPVVTTDRYEPLHLEAKAAEYRQVMSRR